MKRHCTFILISNFYSINTGRQDSLCIFSGAHCYDNHSIYHCLRQGDEDTGFVSTVFSTHFFTIVFKSADGKIFGLHVVRLEALILEEKRSAS